MAQKQRTPSPEPRHDALSNRSHEERGGGHDGHGDGGREWRSRSRSPGRKVGFPPRGRGRGRGGWFNQFNGNQFNERRHGWPNEYNGHNNGNAPYFYQ